MAEIRMLEKKVLEEIFNRGGYVLDFSNRSFAEFFKENGIDIEEEKYYKNGTSKMNRLRTFWEIEEDETVGRILNELLDYGLAVGELDKDQLFEDGLKIASKLTGIEFTTKDLKSEEDFLNQNFEKLNIDSLNLDLQLLPVIRQRLQEIQISLQSNASFSVVLLCGSTLEGLLHDCASKKPQLFNQAKAAPKDNQDKIILFPDWTLNSLIDVAHEIGLISLDVKKFSHSLKDFRNFIHPREQALHQFNPDNHTAEICWKVLQAAIADLIKERK